MSKSNYVLFMHSIIMPFLLLHWIVGDNTCILTTIETEIQYRTSGKIDERNCFTCNLINPVYDIGKNPTIFYKLTHVIVIIVWMISVKKLYDKVQNGEIKNWRDLYKF